MKSVRNQKGQFLVEAVLLMIILVGVFVAGINVLRDSKMLSKLISGPWSQVSGMIESGVWMDPAAARQKHPNQIDRSLAPDPKDYK